MSFDFNILSDLLFTVPFVVGYTNMSAFSRAMLRKDIYMEQTKEYTEWMEYERKKSEDAKEDSEWNLVGKAIGAIVGFAACGPGCAATGWQVGGTTAKLGRQLDGGNFDEVAYLRSNPYLKGGKFYAHKDLATYEQAMDDAQAQDLAEQLDIAFSLATSAISVVSATKNPWATTDVSKKDWKGLGFAPFEKIGLWIEDANKTMLDRMMSIYDRMNGSGLPLDEINVKSIFEEFPEWDQTVYDSQKKSIFKYYPDYGALMDESNLIIQPPSGTTPTTVEEALDNIGHVVTSETGEILDFEKEVSVPATLEGINKSEQEMINKVEELLEYEGIQTPLMPTTTDYPKTDVLVGDDAYYSGNIPEQLSVQERSKMLQEYDREPPMIQQDSSLLFDSDSGIDQPVMTLPYQYSPSTGGPIDTEAGKKLRDLNLAMSPFEDWHPFNREWRESNDKFLYGDKMKSWFTRRNRNIQHPGVPVTPTEDVLYGQDINLVDPGYQSMVPESPEEMIAGAMTTNTLQQMIARGDVDHNAVYKIMQHIKSYGIENAQFYGAPLGVDADLFNWVLDEVNNQRLSTTGGF